MSSDTPDRWVNKINSLKEGIGKIYETKKFSDVVFLVGSKRFEAHRLVLAARCPEFSRILLGPYSVNEIVVEDETVTEIGFEILLRFIYTDKVGTDDKQAIVEAYLAADCFKYEKLLEKCEDLIESWSNSVEEVCELMNVSLGIIKLKEKCLHFIKNNSLDVISSSSFLNLNYKALVTILENDVLKDVEMKKRTIRIVDWVANMNTNPINYALIRDDFMNNSPALLSAKIVNFMAYKQTGDRSILPEWYKSS